MRTETIPDCPCCGKPPPTCVCAATPLHLKLKVRNIPNATTPPSPPAACDGVCDQLNGDYLAIFVSAAACPDAWQVWETAPFSVAGCAAPGDLTNRKWFVAMKDRDASVCYIYVWLVDAGDTWCDNHMLHRTSSAWFAQRFSWDPPWDCVSPIRIRYNSSAWIDCDFSNFLINITIEAA